LEKVCEINPPTNNLPEEFLYIDLDAVEMGKLKKIKMTLKKNAPSRAQRLLEKGDVIFQMVRPYQKNNYYFNKKDDLNYVASTGYAQLRNRELSSYLFHYIHCESFVDNVLEKSTGSNYPAINSSSLAEINVAIPSLPEQRKIADCLSSLDEVIEARDKKITALKNHKKSLMQRLFPKM